ncbi:hypothetical protein AZC_3590 [Azorhizobium caulinodans ORS 571]|uniref:Phosphoribosyl-ATP pyrophosphohydrolase n=1 Tax=Azorhizobium caulinodans (strain ATCC 43989 / DSM 5975 / JCM 20966 / LMG 6465 / NBRC 14845 / NCIMB 13405 / ORS 571) TaxID=438753 RepID=A8IF84_AZOC5|nr:hypothetical protein [Azorhizobium caulinodans]BAF89588.1 hypothetical protein AZC_3590 [Azorhizobium caulinodans ORS 571]
MTGVSELTPAEGETPLTGMLTEFREKFDASSDPALWKKLIAEEEREVAEAAAALLKELADLFYVLEGFRQVGGDVGEVIPTVHEWVVDLVFAIPNPIRVEVMRRVHASNMSKLGADGRPIRREDGKVLKGPNYQPPNLLDLTFIGDDDTNNPR